MTRAPSWFLGLQVADPHELLHAVADAPVGIHPTHPEDLHVTVSFLGGVDASVAHRAFSFATTRLPTAISATAGSPILLGPSDRPWAICASFAAGGTTTAEVIAALGNPCRVAVGLTLDDREPVAHCTIAAIDRKVSGQMRAELIEWAEALETAGRPIRLDTLGLYTLADPSAPTRYRCLDSVSLVWE